MAIILFCRRGHDLSVYDGTIRLGPITRREAVRRVQRDRWERQQPRQPFCSKCGAPTLDACEHCKAPIPKGHRPAYCGQCGKPFPWTEEALRSAKEYTDELDIPLAEKEALKQTFDDLTLDSPRTELAAHRFKKLIQKVGPAAGDALKTILVSVLSEAGKKLLGF